MLRVMDSLEICVSKIVDMYIGIISVAVYLVLINLRDKNSNSTSKVHPETDGLIMCILMTSNCL